MKFSGDPITGRNQLQWAVLLLAAAVVLPTVSLLWFMSRVVANERLATREKLASLYQDKLSNAAKKTGAICSEKLSALNKIKSTANPYSIVTHLVLENGFEGVVVLNSGGAVIYPASVDVVSGEAATVNPLADAQRLEFTGGQYAEALQLYDKFSTNADLQVATAAIMGKSRCLSRLGRLDEAIENCQKAAFISPAQDTAPSLLVAIENARLLLLSMLKQSSGQTGQSQSRPEIFRRTANLLFTDLYNPAGDRALLPANQNLFIAKKFLQMLDNSSLLDSKAEVEKDRIAKLVAAEEFSVSVAENSSIVRVLASRPTDTFFRVGTGYGLCRRTQSQTLLVLLSNSGIVSTLAAYRDLFAGSESSYRIVDASGNFVAGASQPQGSPFVTAPLPAYLPGWSVELYFEGGEVFEKAAKRQIAIYIWTGVLVILFIIAAGGFAVKAVGRQIRLNKMKNDFIATVSHELKTPLASMRVLVDTLLEGNIKNQEQSEEYLRMTARENERLSR